MLFNHFIIFASLVSFTSASALPSRSTHYSTNPQTIHKFPYPTWVENIAVRHNGQILVTLVTTPDLYLLDPHPNSTATLIHTFAPFSAVLGITETKPDIFHLISSNFTLTPFVIANGTYTIQTIDFSHYNPVTHTGALIKPEILIPSAALLNGLSTLSPEKGLIIAADSILGRIWLINTLTSTYTPLLTSPLLAPAAGTPMALGINGIRVLAPSSKNDTARENDTRYIYLTNTSKALFLRVPISLSTLAPVGAIQTLATNISVDDFALDPHSGYAYLAVALENAVYRVPLEGGEPEFVFGGVNSTEIPNPSSVAVARGYEGYGWGNGGNGRGRIYVTTTGGLEGPVDGTFVEGGEVVGYEFVLGE